MSGSLLLSWAFLTLCTLGCIASLDSARTSDTRKDHLASLANFLADTGRPRRKASAPVKEFFDEYYAAKVKDDRVPMWNLLPVNFATKDLRADKIKVLQTTSSDANALSNRETAVYQFSFEDVETVKAEIVVAELRLKIPRAGSPRGILCAYQLLEPARNSRTARKLLASWRISEPTNATSIVLDVTSLAKEWLRSTQLNHGMEFEFLSETGAVLPPALPASPLLVLYINSNQYQQHKVDETRQRRHVTPSKRQTNLKTLDGLQPPATPDPSGTPPCGVKETYVTKQEMGLEDVLYFPTGITFTYCSGHCNWPFPQTVNATNSGRIQGRVAVLTAKVPEPCCAPKEYDNVTYVFRSSDGSGIEAVQLEQAKVISCECK